MEGEKSSLEEVIRYLEADHSFLFSYKKEDVQEVEIKLPTEALLVEEFLTTILQNKNIEFEIVKMNYIILTRSDIEPFSKKEKEVRSLLCGKVIDELSRSPLPFANVYIKGTQTGVSTQEDGSFELETILKPLDTLRISYVGYETQSVLASEMIDQPCKTISLKYFEFKDDFIVIKDYLTDGIDLKENGAATTLQPNRIGALPGQAEPDVLSTIQFLPGVVSPDGSASNINIRGGTSDQNLILWEDIPIYHSAHYFGMISAFNPYIIDKTSVYRGGFDAEYGGRISGVIDMRSGDRSSENHEIGVGGNFLNAYAHGKLNLLDNKASLVFSVRHSMSGIWRSPTFENITRRIQQGVLFDFISNNNNDLPDFIHFDDHFKFVDHNLKYSQKVTEKDEISVAWFYANNDFCSVIFNDMVKQEQYDSLYLKNIGGSFSWTHHWTSDFSTKLLALGTNYRYDYNYQINTLGEMTPDKAGIKLSEIKEQQFHLINTYSTKADHTIKLGYLFNHYDVAYEVKKEARNGPRNNIGSKIETDLQVLYASFNTANEKRYGVDVGARASYFHNAKDLFFEPRLRFWFNLSDDWRLYANTGKYHQFLSQVVQLKGDQSSIDTPVWAIAGEDVERNNPLPILTATQNQFGIIYQKKGWLLDLQTYYKNVKGLTSVATGFDDGISDEFLVGDAKIKGLDILIKKRRKSFRSWMSYSLGRSDHSFKSFFDPEFPAPNDLRHVFHFVTQWKKNAWECSVGWKLTSGSPHSNRQHFKVEVETTPSGPTEFLEPLVNSFNSSRLPYQHQLDASIVYNFLPDHEKWKTVVGISLFNIYNKKNNYERALFLDSNVNNLPAIRYTDKGDMGFTPNVVIRMEW